MPFSIHPYLIMGSFAVLLGCAASETDTPQVELKKSEPQTVSAGQKAYIDPATGKLTSKPPASETQQRSEADHVIEPTSYDIVVNEHGVTMLVPKKPHQHGLKAQMDCDGNLQLGHDIDITKQAGDCTQQDSAKGAN